MLVDESGGIVDFVVDDDVEILSTPTKTRISFLHYFHSRASAESLNRFFRKQATTRPNAFPQDQTPCEISYLLGIMLRDVRQRQLLRLGHGLLRLKGTTRGKKQSCGTGGWKIF